MSSSEARKTGEYAASPRKERSPCTGFQRWCFTTAQAIASRRCCGMVVPDVVVPTSLASRTVRLGTFEHGWNNSQSS